MLLACSIQVRYSATSQRVYFEHTDGTTGGCGTLSHILDFRQEKNGTVKVRKKSIKYIHQIYAASSKQAEMRRR